MIAPALRPAVSRRAALGAAMSSLSTLFASRPARAEDVLVPVGLQVALLAKVAAYDRNFVARTVDRVRVLILTKYGDAASKRLASHLEAAFERIGSVGSFPHECAAQHFQNAETLNRQCRRRSIGIVYVTPGLEGDLPQIVAAVTGLDLLSVSTSPAHVPARVVLGFDLVSGKPQMLIPPHAGAAAERSVWSRPAAPGSGVSMRRWHSYVLCRARSRGLAGARICASAPTAAPCRQRPRAWTG